MREKAFRAERSHGYCLVLLAGLISRAGIADLALFRWVCLQSRGKCHARYTDGYLLVSARKEAEQRMLVSVP